MDSETSQSNCYQVANQFCSQPFINHQFANIRRFKGLIVEQERKQITLLLVQKLILAKKTLLNNWDYFLCVRLLAKGGAKVMPRNCFSLDTNLV